MVATNANSPATGQHRSGGVNARVFQKVLHWLSPWEAALMHLQSLLVWEKTRPSLLFTAGVHCFFWYVALSNHGTYFVLCSGALILVLLDLWKGYIWPEIKGRSYPLTFLTTFRNYFSVQDEFDNEESWVPIHARLLSVHDVSLIIAQQWSLWSSRFDRLWALRRNRPMLFCILTSVFFMLLAWLGSRVRGTALVYLAFVTAMTLPCLIYHGILEAFKSKALPVWHRLDRHLEEQAKWEDPREASMQEAQLCPNSESLRADIEKIMREPGSTMESDDELMEFIPTEDLTIGSRAEDDLGFHSEEIAAVLEGR